jgi:nitroimidazol reductase NimA-like FMN-containing flavoprotein (pyridoxamine 5'-phosphate oxidase superfamily)
VGLGTATVVDTEADKVRALELLTAKYAPGEYRKTFDPIELTRVKIIRVDIESMTGKKSGF